jgi:anti-sigma-K factor RskA
VEQDRFVELAPDYALGLLEGEELESFERHLAAGCSACEVELARMDSVGDALAYAVPLTPAPEHLRERVLAAVDADLAEEKARAKVSTAPSQAPRPSHAPEIAPTYEPAPWPPPKPPVAPPKPPGIFSRLAPALAFAGILAAALTGAYAFKLRQQLAYVRADLERVQAENQALARVMDVVNSPKLRIVALGGQAPSPTSQAHVLWSPESKKAVFYAYGLPAPPAGKDYQLWVIEGDTKRSEGVFPVDAQGTATHVLPEVPEPSGIGAFAVTLEPAGGVPQPTGAIYLLGAVSAKVD